MKRILCLLIIFLYLIVPKVYAKTPETFQRTKENNYGVNKDWKINSSNLENIKKTPLVDANEKIYDFSNILTDEEESMLKSKIDTFREKTNMEIVIVTDSLPYNDDKENEVYADDFYDYNDFGINDKYYSGILLFRNTYEYGPYYDMSTTGNAMLYYGTSRVDAILDDIYDYIVDKEYFLAFNLFIDELDGYYNIGKDSELDGYNLDKNGHMVSPISKISWILAFTVPIIVSGLITWIFVRKNKMILKATTANRYLDHKSIIINKRIDKFITSHTTSYTESSSSGGHSGGGHSSSSSHRSSSGGSHGGGGRHG